MKFDLDIKLTKYSWSWVFRFSFNRRCLEYDNGLWEYHNGFGKKGKHHYWGKRRPYKHISQPKEVSK